MHPSATADLHNHLYGSISAEKLYEIGKKNPYPRWNLFTELHNRLYKDEIRTENFFEDYQDISRFKNLYLFNKRAPFLEFQSKFNLIIALSRFDEEEIRYVAEEVVTEHASQDVTLAEYRIMYSPLADSIEYKNKTIAACEGLKQGEESSKNQIQARLVVSLHRDGNYIQEYEWLKQIMQGSELVNKYLVGIDFCYMEEGFPPSEKKEFFQKVLMDNHDNPQSALSILYHVGESFADKTPKSAVRWVGESALYGAHRLGHCIALGIKSETFFNRTISETVKERLDQIEFEIQDYEKLKSFGVTIDYSNLQKEKELLVKQRPEVKIALYMDKKYVDELYTFQEYIMHLIKEETSAVIEFCPTSNLYIGMLPEMKDHPIRRFVDRGMRVTIGSDDPGILDTTMKKEFELAAIAGLSQSELSEIQKASYLYASEILSGRKT